MKKSDKKAARALQSRTFKRVLLYIKPYGLFVFSSLLCAAISVAAQLIDLSAARVLLLATRKRV